MKKIKEKKENMNNILMPFRYNKGIVFSNTLAGEAGFYGLNNSSLFFISSDKLEDELEIEIIDNIEELAEITQSIEFIVQHIAVNSSVAVLGSISDLSHADKLKPFVDFMTNYEKGLQLVEGLRNGIIS